MKEREKRKKEKKNEKLTEWKGKKESKRDK